MDFKYRTENPNVLCWPSVEASPFWKGVVWAMQATRLGIKWKLGNGEKVRFWEDHWLGNTNLAISEQPEVEDEGKKVISPVFSLREYENE